MKPAVGGMPAKQRSETLAAIEAGKLDIVIGTHALLQSDIAFADLFLQDVRRYREERLQGSGLTPLFPLFGADTRALAQEMIGAGLRARITCVDPRAIDRRFAGREYDATLLAELPSSADPCGERGEFHTFAYHGPMFRQPIAIDTGPTVEREGFVFTDLTKSA